MREPLGITRCARLQAFPDGFAPRASAPRKCSCGDDVHYDVSTDDGSIRLSVVGSDAEGPRELSPGLRRQPELSGSIGLMTGAPKGGDRRE